MVTGHLGTIKARDLFSSICLWMFVDKLKIHIPWKHLYSHPTKIELDGLYLLLTSQSGLMKIHMMIDHVWEHLDVTYDPEQAEEEVYQSKIKEVEKVEKFRREREQYGRRSSIFQTKKNLSFFSPSPPLRKKSIDKVHITKIRFSNVYNFIFFAIWKSKFEIST